LVKVILLIKGEKQKSAGRRVYEMYLFTVPIIKKFLK